MSDSIGGHLPTGAPAMGHRPYTMGEQLPKGLEGEAFLDGFFNRWFEIYDFSKQGAGFKRYMQQLGVDRLWIGIQNRHRYFVEYKTDERAGQTRKAFIETVSMDSKNKAGWVYTSTASVLVYYVPPLGEIYVAHLLAIRAMVPQWLEKYKTKQIPNPGYNSEGIPVPLPEIQKLAWQYFNLLKSD